MTQTLQESIINRRSFYHLSKENPLTDNEIIDLITLALKNTPSAFNMQSARVTVLFSDAHDLLWQTTADILRPLVPTDKWNGTKQKIDGFGAAYGTVLFFEDSSIVTEYANRFAAYKDNFSVWAEQANGMLQSNIWMLLENAGFGASLQHYNPLIDDDVHSIWDIPENWRLIAQMPFGKPTHQPDEKTFVPTEERIKIFTE